MNLKLHWSPAFSREAEHFQGLKSAVITPVPLHREVPLSRTWRTNPPASWPGKSPAKCRTW
jgi:hypothetical protein